MRENKYTQMLAIEGKDPQDVAIKFNQAMISLKNDNPTYQMVSPTLFYIYYEREQIHADVGY